MISPDLSPEAIAAERRRNVASAAEEAGWLQGGRDRVGARIHSRLLAAAKARSGLTSDTDLIEYALARVALEDDFGAKLLELTGSIPADIDLEF
jgi:hypothetical protein